MHLSVRWQGGMRGATLIAALACAALGIPAAKGVPLVHGGGKRCTGEPRAPGVGLPAIHLAEDTSKGGVRRFVDADGRVSFTPSALNPQPSTLNPQPSTLNPQPST